MAAASVGVITLMPTRRNAADRWTWLIIAAHTQLRLAGPLAADLRRPWETATPGRLTPARVPRPCLSPRTTSAPPASAPGPQSRSRGP
jgi:hypothetical protein